MGTPYLPTDIRGLLLHDARFGVGNIDTTLSTATQSSPVPGQPQPDQKGTLHLQTAGVYGDESIASTYTVDTIKSGGVGSGADGAEYTWSDDGDTFVTGWHAPNVVTGVGAVVTTPNNAGAGYAVGGAVSLSDGTVVLVYEDRTGNPDEVHSIRLDPATGTWSGDVTIDVLDSTQNGDNTRYSTPCLVRLPDNATNSGRLIALYWKVNSNNSAQRQLASAYSDDDGVSWTNADEELHTLTVGSVTRRCVAIYHRGYISLVHGDAGGSVHLVSRDFGATFTTIAGGGKPNLVTDSAGNLVGLARSGDDVEATKQTSPFSSFTTSAFVETIGSTPEITTPHTVFGSCIDDDGVGWIASRKDSGGASGDPDSIFLFSFDPDGLTDSSYSRNRAAVGRNHPIELPGYTSIAVQQYGSALVPYRGGLLLLCTFGTGSGFTTTEQNASIWGIKLGGYSEAAWESRSFGRASAAVLSGRAYLPIDTLANSGFTEAGAGVQNGTVSGTQVVNAIADTRRGFIDGAAGVSTIVRIGADTNQVTFVPVCEIIKDTGAGSNNYTVRLELTTTGARLFDVNAAAVVGSSATVPTGVTEYQIIMEGARVRGWYKDPNLDTWSVISGGSLTAVATVIANNRVTIGNVAGAGTHRTDIAWLGVSFDDQVGNTDMALAGTVWNTDHLFGFPLSSQGAGRYIDNALRLRSASGFTFVEDSWSVPPRYQFGFDQIDPARSSSPQEQLRTEDTSAQFIAWDLGTSTRMLSSSIGIALVGCNFKEAFFEGATSSGGPWDTLVTMDTSTDLAADDYQIDGTWVAPATTTAAGGRTVRMSELQGAHVSLDDGAASTIVAKIDENSEGVWMDPVDNRAIELQVSANTAEGDDLSTLTAPTTAQVYYPSIVGVVHNLTTPYRYFRLRWAAQGTYDRDFRVGTVIVGPLAVFGWQYSWGRVLPMETNTAISQDDNGKRRLYELGNPRRAVQFGWADPIPEDDVHDPTPDPGYVRARDNAAYPGISLRQNASLIEGVIRRQASGTVPVVYLPLIPNAVSGDSSQIVGRESILYGHIVGGTSRTARAGRENHNEVLAVDPVRIEELI